MAEIDLIPTDYRNRIWLQGRARGLAGVTALLLVLLCRAAGMVPGAVIENLRTGLLRSACSH